MKVKRLRQIEVVTDVRCDVCGCSTVMAEGYSVCCKPLGAMARLMMANSTKLSYVGLCFFDALAQLRRSRQVHFMFSDEQDWNVPDFGLVKSGSGEL